MKISDIKKMLAKMDGISLAGRARRVRTLVKLQKKQRLGILLHGGSETAYALEEARAAYVNRLFLSTCLLCLVVIERHLAGVLYASGHDEAKRMTVEQLLRTGLERQLLTAKEAEVFSRLRGIRNSYTHFRPPMHDSALIHRSLSLDVLPEELVEQDANDAIAAVERFVSNRDIGQMYSK